jgi:hypothetical protein
VASTTRLGFYFKTEWMKVTAGLPDRIGLRMCRLPKDPFLRRGALLLFGSQAGIGRVGGRLMFRRHFEFQKFDKRTMVGVIFRHYL